VKTYKGETRKKLDVILIQILKDILKDSGYVPKAISQKKKMDVVACILRANICLALTPMMVLPTPILIA